MSAATISGTSSTAATADQNAAATMRIPGKALGQQDFLQLLVAQLSAQDPMNPQKDTDFIAQMAQFTALEQSQGMRADLTAMRLDQQVQQANALIGRTVLLQPAKGEPVIGVVSGLAMVEGAPQIVVGDTPHPLSELVRVMGSVQPAS